MSRVVSFFDPIKEENFELQQVFNAVMSNNVEDLKGQLYKNIKLLSRKSSVTDEQGRTFKHISPFQLAIWYLNDELIKIMINILYTEKDLQLQETLLTQMNYILFSGINYQYEDGKVTDSTHYNYERLIKTYQQLCPDGKKDFLDVIGKEGVTIPFNIVKDLSQLYPPLNSEILNSFFQDKVQEIHLLKENLQGLFTVVAETSV